jgi:MFS transporter, DHA1 family, tetracycline resistance protein
MGFSILPESLPKESRMPFAWRRANPMGSLALIRSKPQLVGLSIVNFLDYLAHASLPSMSVLYMMYRYGWDERVVGLTMAAVGVCAMVVQGGLIMPIVKTLGEHGALIFGLAFGIAGFATFGIAETGTIFWIGIPLLALWGVANPASLGRMSHLVGPSEQGQLQGANASMMGIANLVGPGLFTQVFAYFIGAGTAWHLPGAPFVLAAVLVMLATFIAAWAAHRGRYSPSG